MEVFKACSIISCHVSYMEFSINCLFFFFLFFFLPLFTGLEERSNGGSPVLRPLLPTMSPPDSVVSYEDDFVSSQGSGTLTDKQIALEPR